MKSLSISQKNRRSSSSEDQNDTSNETLDMEDNNIDSNNIVGNPGPSFRDEPTSAHQVERPEPEEEQIIREAEAARVKIFNTPGKRMNNSAQVNVLERMALLLQDNIDDNYLVIGGMWTQCFRLELLTMSLWIFPGCFPEKN